AKAEILSHPFTEMGILSSQSASFSCFSESNCKKITFGVPPDEEVDFLLQSGCIQEKEERSPSLTLPFTASHLCENFTGAVAVARTLGMSWPEILPQIPKLTPFPGRFQTVTRNGIVFINDAYNANPTSMNAALANLPSPQQGKKRIAV